MYPANEWHSAGEAEAEAVNAGASHISGCSGAEEWEGESSGDCRGDSSGCGCDCGLARAEDGTAKAEAAEAEGGWWWAEKEAVAEEEEADALGESGVYITRHVFGVAKGCKTI